MQLSNHNYYYTKYLVVIWQLSVHYCCTFLWVLLNIGQTTGWVFTSHKRFCIHKTFISMSTKERKWFATQTNCVNFLIFSPPVLEKCLLWEIYLNDIFLLMFYKYFECVLSFNISIQFWTRNGGTPTQNLRTSSNGIEEFNNQFGHVIARSCLKAKKKI